MRIRFIAAGTATTVAAATVALTLAVGGSDAASTKTVRVQDYAFVPSTVSVRRNTTVKWVWTGKATHNVETTTGPKSFHSQLMKKGSFSKRFTKKGTYRIDCMIHSGTMRMVVKVR